MKIDAIDSGIHDHRIGKSQKQENNEETNDLIPSLPDPFEASNVTSEAGDVEVEDESGGRAHGVLRLLQEGHFKGVADLRLRINFADEIAALESENIKAASADGAPALSDSVSGSVNSLVDQGIITQEQANEFIETFQQDIDLAIKNFHDSQDPATSGLVTDLTSVFDALVAALTAAHQGQQTQSQDPTVPRSDSTQMSSDSVAQIQTDDTQPTDPPSQDPASDITADNALTSDPVLAQGQVFDFQAFIDYLTDSFTDALDEFVNSLSSSGPLPELSEPNGNGKAYQKFLDIYNQMHANTAEVVDSLEPVTGTVLTQPL
ncbi:MAG: hypothetical protein ACYTBP_07720 [Planctomycetota bacterium]|jgi:hypothetical protein